MVVSSNPDHGIEDSAQAFLSGAPRPGGQGGTRPGVACISGVWGASKVVLGSEVALRCSSGRFCVAKGRRLAFLM